MKLQILSTIVAMSMAGASATAVDCGTVQTIYQNSQCCSDTGAETCAHKLEVASSDTYLVLDDATGMLTTKPALAAQIYQIESDIGGDSAYVRQMEVALNAAIGSNLNAIGSKADASLYNEDSGKPSITGDTTITGDATITGDIHLGGNYYGDEYLTVNRKGSNSEYIFRVHEQTSPDLPGSNPEVYLAKTRVMDDVEVQGSITLRHGLNTYSETSGFVITSGYSHNSNDGAAFRHFYSAGSNPPGTGKVYIDVHGVDVFRLADLSTLQLTNNAIVASDRRIKKNIETIPDNLALETFRGLDAKYYNYISEKRTTIKQIGFIAQEVREAIPEAVSVMPGTLPDGTEVDDFHYIDKAKIFAVAYSALQEVDKTQQALLATVAALEARLALLE